METKTTRAPDAAGMLLGTERLAVPPPLAAGASTGASFARELERAAERSRGTELEAERKAEIASARRAARHASFGRDGAEEPESDVWAAEAVFKRSEGPVKPASALLSASSGDAGTKASGAPVPTADARAVSSAASTAAAEPPMLTASPAAAGPSATTSVVPPPSTAALAARATATAPEPPLAPPVLERAGAVRGSKPASAPPPPADAPDAALLERAEEILRQIRLHAAPGVRRITLSLEPAELGHLSIQLALRAGKVAAIVRGEDRATLELLQRHETDLLQVFAQRGIATDSVRYELGFGTRRAAAGAREPATALSARAERLSTPRSGDARVDTLA